MSVKPSRSLLFNRGKQKKSNKNVELLYILSIFGLSEKKIYVSLVKLLFQSQLNGGICFWEV